MKNPIPSSLKALSHYYSILSGAVLLIVVILLALPQHACAQAYAYANTWFTTNGVAHIATGDVNRGLAYGAISNEVYVCNKGTPAIDVFDAVTGNYKGSAVTTGVTGGTFLLDQVGVADDGSIYSADLTTSLGGSAYRIYQWTNWNAAPNPCYVGDPSGGTLPGKRMGDNIAVTGSGTGTIIAVPVENSTTPTTNVVLFSTVDGANFTPTVLNIAGMPAPSGNQGPTVGITFYSNDSFLYKPNGTAIYLVQFPANFASMGSPVQATVIATNSSFTAGSQLVLDYSETGGLLAALGPIPNAAPTTTPVNLYFSNPFSGINSSLGGTTFAHANANGNFVGAVALGGAGKTNLMFTLDCNNGVRGWALTFTPAAVSPVISVPPVLGSVYTNIGSLTINVTAEGSQPLTYIWQYNTVSNLSTATTLSVTTNNYYTINPLTIASSGWYDVIVTNASGSTNSAPALLTVLSPTTSPVVTPLWSLPGGSLSFLDSTSYATRGLAYDPVSQTLVVADHSNLHLLASTNGEYLGDLDPAGVPIVGYAGWIFDQVGVSADGTLYAANLTLTGPGYVIVSWAPGWTVGSTASSYAFSDGSGGGADPSGTGDRWGDTMDVRGSGTSTEILIGSYSGTNVVLFTTADGVTFTPNLIAVTNVSAAPGFSGQGIAFGAGDTFWAKSPGYNLRLISFDRTTTPWTGGAVETFTAGTQISSGLGGIGVDVSSNILGGVDFDNAPNDFQLYTLSGNTNPPSLFDQTFFGSNYANIQENSVARLKGGKGFALDVNNGITAVSYSVPAAPAVAIIAVTHTPGSTTLTWANTFNGHHYQVQSTTSLSPASWSNLGSAVTATGPTASYTDNTAGGGTRFYRVVSQ